jgi:hypothetical protein
MRVGAVLVVAVACNGRDPVELPNDSGFIGTQDLTLPTLLSSTPCDACGGDCLVEELAYEAGPLHISDPLDYADPPPAGGPHNPCWATWGVHTEPVLDDNFVHNLEHGGVVWLYACDPTDAACAADVETLTTLATDVGLFALVTPYPDMEPRYATLAWGWRLTTGCVDLALQQAFYDDHVDRAPESLPSDPSTQCM